MHLLAAGTHTKVVQEHLGHSTAITADRYGHLGPVLQRGAALLATLLAS